MHVEDCVPYTAFLNLQRLTRTAGTVPRPEETQADGKNGVAAKLT